MQIRQRIFKHTAMQVLYFFSRQNLQTFDISHAFLSQTIAKLSTFKNVRFLLAHPVHEALVAALLSERSSRRPVVTVTIASCIRYVTVHLFSSGMSVIVF